MAHWKHAAGWGVFASQGPFVKLAQLCGRMGWWGCRSGAGDEFSWSSELLPISFVHKLREGALIRDLLQKSRMVLRFIFLVPNILFPNSPFQDRANSLER